MNNGPFEEFLRIVVDQLDGNFKYVISDGSLYCRECYSLVVDGDSYAFRLVSEVDDMANYSDKYSICSEDDVKTLINYLKSHYERHSVEKASFRDGLSKIFKG